MNYFRTKRMKDFLSAYPDLRNLSVLDVGGRPYIWKLIKKKYNIVPKSLVLLNTEDEKKISQKDFYIEIGDGTKLHFVDNCFDLVFSNSVIEHVGSFRDMEKFASECMRVGKEIYIQTPCKYFFIEPHIVTLFIHFFPKSIYRKFVFLSLRYISLRNNTVQFYKIFDGINLLTATTFRRLFPEKKITFEKFIFLKKSMIASDRLL